MKEKLELKHLAPYLPYNLPMLRKNKEGVWKQIHMNNGNIHYPIENTESCKLILRKLSDIDKQINYGNQSYALTEIFEVGDDGGYVYEFDHGNVKLIQQLKTIGKYNVYHDFNFMPYAVAQELFERHFDVFGLIEAGFAVYINNTF